MVDDVAEKEGDKNDGHGGQNQAGGDDQAGSREGFDDTFDFLVFLFVILATEECEDFVNVKLQIVSIVFQKTLGVDAAGKNAPIAFF